MMAACSTPSRHVPDAPIDSPVDGPSGSAAHGAMDGIEPSPRDHNLELGVLAASLVVAAGPVRARQRRRRRTL